MSMKHKWWGFFFSQFWYMISTIQMDKSDTLLDWEPMLSDKSDSLVDCISMLSDESYTLLDWESMLSDKSESQICC